MAGIAPAADANREMLVRRWFALTRAVLPALAARHRWPIRRDHCFMRVCLDNAFGRPWRTVVAAPAVRNMTGAELLAAVAVAESIAAAPDLLPALNRESLLLRRR